MILRVTKNYIEYRYLLLTLVNICTIMILHHVHGRRHLFMDMSEYQKVRNLTYLEYCDYLQDKYGIGLADYMTKSYNMNPKCKRTKEGLIAHHKKEDTMIMLSTKAFAQICPFEWQKKENIVYCDYLEHLLLHVLICKYPSNEKEDFVLCRHWRCYQFYCARIKRFVQRLEYRTIMEKNLP